MGISIRQGCPWAPLMFDVVSHSPALKFVSQNGENTCLQLHVDGHLAKLFAHDFLAFPKVGNQYGRKDLEVVGCFLRL